VAGTRLNKITQAADAATSFDQGLL